LACLIQAREEKKMNKKISKWLTFAALLMFVGATFQIASDHYMLGVICFAAAVSFSCSAEVYRKKEKEEKKKEADDK
jgi:1,4-dihydroxy-2-naphthoate octaprenyltransferase